MISPKAILGCSVFGLVLILGFQNCSNKTQFTQTAASSLAVATSEPTPELVNGEPVICDPFSAQSTCSAASGSPGLMGDIYYLTSSDRVSAKLANYYATGIKVASPIILSELNITLRGFESGFPSGIDAGGKTTYIIDNKGETLIEYFALKLDGFVTVAAEAEGSYQFAIESDDGSILTLDGHKIIDNDGTHSMKRAESSGLVSLQRNIKYPINVGYFQGPRTEIGLMMYWRKCAELSSSTSCSKFGAWSLVPKAVLSH